MSEERLWKFRKPEWMNSSMARSAGVYGAGALVSWILYVLLSKKMACALGLWKEVVVDGAGMHIPPERLIASILVRFWFPPGGSIDYTQIA